ncbi:MAG: NUDIX domain-containing protein [Acetobacteraceae bacterium]|jgi:ADP-ribose pyrophosphatase YjhB (NUDIX family)
MVFTEPRLGCGAAIVIDGRILLVRRLSDPEAGCWGLPGGKVDLYETVAAAVEREINEELGIEIKAGKLLCLVDQIDKLKGEHWFAPVFLVTKFTGDARIVEPDKHGGLAWFPLDAVPDALTRSTIEALGVLRDAGAAS